MTVSTINGDRHFGPIRERAYQVWLATTFRNCEGINDDITGSYECKWQDRARANNYEHISIFCSLGEWANNVTDLLKDTFRDAYSFTDFDQSQALFRYYTRMLLVTSEMLVDFVDILDLVMPGHPKARRKLLSDNPFGVDDLLGYVNTVCKHKAGRIHYCNHHLPIWFEDCAIPSPYDQPLRVKNLDYRSPDSVLVPRLGDILMTVIGGYNRLHELFEADEEKFKVVCDKYASPNPED